MLCISIMNREGRILGEETGHREAMLCVDHVWEQGDVVSVRAPACSHISLGIDASMLQGEVFLPGGELRWRVPFGEERLAYTPGLFDGLRHALHARLLSADEIGRERDLARNPLDLRGDTDFFPHCTANVETRGEAVFAARNVIDGLRFNTFHGEWPYESWGIGAREDAWCRLDFCRDIYADRMALTLRADFPHDAWWVSGHVVTSDGRDMAFTLEKTGERQFISLGGAAVSWLRLERMVKSDDPSAFPSLRSWEVFGHDT